MKPVLDPVGHAIDYTIRQDRGRLIAALVANVGDFELAEESLQEAAMAALADWAKNGVPKSRRGWLLQVARRKAIDSIRRSGKLNMWRGQLEQLAKEEEMDANATPPDIPDKRLELIFTCCHPALDPKSRVALTLRTIGGLKTPEIARAFLDKDATMGQRLSRARSKIAGAGIAFKIPEPADWDDRLHSVLSVIYLIFNEGYSASTGKDVVRIDLCEEAIFLGRLLNHLRPQEPEILGLLSLMLTIQARTLARMGNVSVTLAEQDRSVWDQGAIADGLALLDQAVSLAQPGPYQIQAAISALHVQAKTAAQTDWVQIVMLYDALLQHEPTPVVRLNRAVALAEAGHLEQALQAINEVAPELAAYQPLFAAKAKYLALAGHHGAALGAFDKAIRLCGNQADKNYLIRQRAKLLN